MKSYPVDVRYCNDLSHHDQCLEEVLEITINSSLVSHVQGCILCTWLASIVVNDNDRTRQISSLAYS